MNLLGREGIHEHKTTHDTPAHNGVVERRNRSLLELCRAMLHDSGLPQFLWAEAVRHATWILNRTPTRSLGGISPLEALTGETPMLSELLPFGQKVLVHAPDGAKTKSRAIAGHWLGLDAHPGSRSNGARIYMPGARRVAIERNFVVAPAAPRAAALDLERAPPPPEPQPQPARGRVRVRARARGPGAPRARPAPLGGGGARPPTSPLHKSEQALAVYQLVSRTSPSLRWSSIATAPPLSRVLHVGPVAATPPRAARVPAPAQPRPCNALRGRREATLSPLPDELPLLKPLRPETA